MTRINIYNRRYLRWFKALIIGIFLIVISVKLAMAASPSLYFFPNNKTVVQNEQFEIEIMVDTAGVDSGGVGAKISFDKNQLEIIKIEPGLIFADYPVLIIDNENGRATISAISSSMNNLFNGNGVVATMTMRAKQAGQAKVNFIFQPGSTTDSNIAVTFGNGDVLETVNQLNLIVNQGNSQSNEQSSDEVVTDGEINQRGGEVDGVKGWINNFFRLINWPEPFEAQDEIEIGRNISAKFDPNEPITRQLPITNPNQQQPGPSDALYVSAANKPSWLNWLGMPEVYWPLLGLVIIVLWLVYRKRFNGGQVNE